MSSARSLTLFVLLACLAGANAAAEVHVGDVFPTLQEAGLTGTTPVTDGKVVVVDFWASWCAPCKASFPALALLHQDFAARGLVIVAVSVDEKPAAYADFIARLNPPFATVRDGRHALVSTVQVPAMPTTYLLDRHGRVRFRHEGFHGQDTEANLRRQIEALLTEKE